MSEHNAQTLQQVGWFVGLRFFVEREEADAWARDWPACGRVRAAYAYAVEEVAP